MRSYALVLCVAACAPAPGKVQIIVTAEDTITQGLQPGTDADSVRDGWTVTYQKFLVTMGDFKAQSSATKHAIEDPARYIVDLKQAGEAGTVVSEFKNVAADIRYDIFGYSIVPALVDTAIVGSVTDADAAVMRSNGYALYFNATLTKDAQTLHLNWGFKGGTAYGNCAPEGGLPGFSVGGGESTTLQPTVHGDHWFFTTDPHSTIPTRLVGWIALCDANADGEVTLDEIKAKSEAELFPTSLGYNLSSLPVKPIVNGFDFFAAMARTIAHFQGDGECEGLTLTDVDPNEPSILQVQ